MCCEATIPKRAVAWVGSWQPECTVPLSTWSFRNFKPEFLLNGKRPRFSVVGAEKRPPGGGKTRGSGTEKRCSHKWFHRIFPCTDPRIEERYLRCSKRFDHRSHSIIFLLFEFKSVDDVGAGKLREMLTLHTNPHAVHGRFTLKDDCERQVWNARAASWTQRENYPSMKYMSN